MAVGGGRGVEVAAGGAVAVGGGRTVQVGVGARGFGVEVGAAANARSGAATLVGVGAGGLGVDVGAIVNTGAGSAVLVGTGVLVAVGARVGNDVAIGSSTLGVAVASCRAGAAWAGSVGLMASVAVGRASVGDPAVQAARSRAARSPGSRAGSGDRGLTEAILRPTVGSVNGQVGRHPPCREADLG